MDTQRDFTPFRGLLDQLCAAFGLGDASDARVEAYWGALKDLSLAEVRANVKRIISTATHDTPLPRPNSLRNKPLSARLSEPDPTRERVERDSARSWERMRRRDPVEYAIQWRIARAARELVNVSPDDPEFLELERQQSRWSALRYAPRAEQEAAVRAYLGIHLDAANDSDAFGEAVTTGTGP